jgi:hypothetical protein
MLTLRQSAETLAPNSCESAVLLITFTLSRTLPRTVSQAEFIEQTKKSSSKWIKALDPRYRAFF